MDPHNVQFDPGAAVEASDGRVGTVDEVVVRPETGALAYLVVRRGWADERLVLPAELVEAEATEATEATPDRTRVRLRVTRDEAFRRGREVPQEALVARAEGDILRIPIAEERLRAGTRAIDLGELRIHRHVEQQEETVRQAVTRDDVTVERVSIDRYIDAPPAVRTEGDTLIVPVLEEVLVVEKRLKLKEELRIRTRQAVEEAEVREMVRRERVELEDASARGVEIVDRRKERTKRSGDASSAASAGAQPSPATPPTPPARKATRYGAMGRTADAPGTARTPATPNTASGSKRQG